MSTRLSPPRSLVALVLSGAAASAGCASTASVPCEASNISLAFTAPDPNADMPVVRGTIPWALRVRGASRLDSLTVLLDNDRMRGLFSSTSGLSDSYEGQVNTLVLGSGPHSVSASGTCTDEDGVHPYFARTSFYVDNGIPSVGIDSPAEGEIVYVEDPNPSVCATARDIESSPTLTLSLFNVEQNSGFNVYNAPATATQVCSQFRSHLASLASQFGSNVEFNYRATAALTDVAGNTAMATSNFRVRRRTTCRSASPVSVALQRSPRPVFIGDRVAVGTPDGGATVYEATTCTQTCTTTNSGTSAATDLVPVGDQYALRVGTSRVSLIDLRNCNEIGADVIQQPSTAATVPAAAGAERPSATGPWTFAIAAADSTVRTYTLTGSSVALAGSVNLRTTLSLGSSANVTDVTASPDGTVYAAINPASDVGRVVIIRGTSATLANAMFPAFPSFDGGNVPPNGGRVLAAFDSGAGFAGGVAVLSGGNVACVTNTGAMCSSAAGLDLATSSSLAADGTRIYGAGTRSLVFAGTFGVTYALNQSNTSPAWENRFDPRGDPSPLRFVCAGAQCGSSAPRGVSLSWDAARVGVGYSGSGTVVFVDSTIGDVVAAAALAPGNVGAFASAPAIVANPSGGYRAAVLVGTQATDQNLVVIDLP